jgi:hypothetical protein
MARTENYFGTSTSNYELQYESGLEYFVWIDCYYAVYYEGNEKLHNASDKSPFLAFQNILFCHSIWIPFSSTQKSIFEEEGTRKYTF